VPQQQIHLRVQTDYDELAEFKRARKHFYVTFEEKVGVSSSNRPTMM
jgi:hypothetical protein